MRIEPGEQKMALRVVAGWIAALLLFYIAAYFVTPKLL